MLTEKKLASLEESAAHWERLADDEPSDSCGRERAKLYRRTAESLRMQMRDGIARCACCLLPLGTHT